MPPAGASLLRLPLVYSSQEEKTMRKVLSLAAILALATAGTLGVRAYAAAADGVAVGSTAPNFSLPSQEDKMVSLSDYKGKWVVLYFYPKDMTTGCTIEAHKFQEDLPKYEALNAVVLGVSLDTVESHKTFCSKDSLTFKLLADPDHKVIDAYGIPVSARGDNKFAQRDTVLISPTGKVVKHWEKVDPNTHSEAVLAEITADKK
jgi:thioredoxin-dependent peroxiredoxin